MSTALAASDLDNNTRNDSWSADTPTIAGNYGELNPMVNLFHTKETLQEQDNSPDVSSSSQSGAESFSQTSPLVSSTTTPTSFPSTPGPASTGHETFVVSPASQTLPSDDKHAVGIRCFVKPCMGMKFGDFDLLRAHEGKAHRYRCTVGCENVGYPSLRDLKTRHYGPFHQLEVGQYKCGRCGNLDFRQDNHTRHVLRTRPCRAASTAQQYVCGRCGDKTFDKEEHLQHLRRRGCETT